MTAQHPKPDWRWRLVAIYSLAIMLFALIAAIVGNLTPVPEWLPIVLSGAFAGVLAGPLMQRWRVLAERDSQTLP